MYQNNLKIPQSCFQTGEGDAAAFPPPQAAEMVLFALWEMPLL